MDSSGATPIVPLSEVLSYSGRGRDTIAVASMRLSSDRPRPSYDTRRFSSDRPRPSFDTRKLSVREPQTFHYFPETIKEQITPTCDSSSRSSTSPSEGTSSAERYQNSIAPDWRRDTIDLESGNVSWPDPAHKQSFGQWMKTVIFRSRVEYKARNPESFREIGFNLRRGVRF